MNDESKTYWTDDPELVEKYVRGQFSREEKERLEREIDDCEPCKQKIREEMEIVAGIRRYGRDSMKERLRRKLKRDRASQFYSYQYISLAAAVVIIAIGIGLYQIWFSDLVAPKKFHQQEIVLKPQEDTSKVDIAPQRSAEQITDQAVTENHEESSSSQQLKKPVAEKAETDPLPSSSSGAGNVSQLEKQSISAMADAEAMSNESKITVNSSAIWLIGKVVMISEHSAAQNNNAVTMEAPQKNDRKMLKEKSAESIPTEKTFALRRAKDEGIILQQRAIKDLPAGLTRQHSTKELEVHTLFERTNDGISITLFGNVVNESDLQEAVVETRTDDSLVVSLPHQRIAFHLPSGWNSQEIRR